ncbi:MAG: STAS domain-containing protein [Actinomycetota bacterium]|nr:STAS domain-containing protein [Actinomycetota bacterium]
MDELQPLRITTAKFGADSYVLALSGELDIGTSDRFEQELDALLDAGARQLVVDLLGITFLGSVGLGLLTRAAKRTRAIGGECVVVSDDPRVIRVFEITGLDRIFRIERSLMEAVSELVGGSAAAVA